MRVRFDDPRFAVQRYVPSYNTASGSFAPEGRFTLASPLTGSGSSTCVVVDAGTDVVAAADEVEAAPPPIDDGIDAADVDGEVVVELEQPVAASTTNTTPTETVTIRFFRFDSSQFMADTFARPAA
jgi:hypothetical protein